MYSKPEIEIVETNDKDIILTSPLTDGGELKLPDAGDIFWG